MFDAHVERMTRVSTEVLGRRTYGLMTYWENDPVDEEWSAAEHEFARLWRGIDKVVVSATLTSADLVGDRARLVPRLELDLTEHRTFDGGTSYHRYVKAATR